MRIMVAGGTGTAGRVLVRQAIARGHEVRVLTRRPDRHPERPGPDLIGGDLTDGRGLAEAVRGVDAVVDLSDAPTTRARAATAFFTAATESLLAAEARAGVGHHLVVSIVGGSEFPSGYYQAKLAQERTAARRTKEAGIGLTVARVTQFHDFAATALHRFRIGGVVLAPSLRLRPVHCADVAKHLLTLLQAGPAGYAPELAGPAEQNLTSMVTRYAQAVGSSAPVVRLPLIGGVRRANRAGVLCSTSGRRGTITFEDWQREVQR